MLLTCDQLWVHQSANNLMKKPRARYSSVSSSKTIHDIKDYSETRDIVLKNMLFYSKWACLIKKECCWATVVQSVAVLLSRASRLHCCHWKSLACPTACSDDYRWAYLWKMKEGDFDNGVMWCVILATWLFPYCTYIIHNGSTLFVQVQHIKLLCNISPKQLWW